MGSQIDWVNLTARAAEARQQAYAPYSGFKVGAALLTATGEIFAGCNVENISFGLTICAERGAVACAIQGGFRDFIGLAIVTESNAPVAPCGACRQVLAEFNPALRVHSVAKEGLHASWSLAELFPAPFKAILKMKR